MQIKVKDTRMHKVNTRYLDLNILGEDVGQVKDRIKEVPVAEAKLVLVEYYAESNNEIREYWKDVTPKTGSLPTWRPILISETEKIEAGDWFLLALEHQPKDYRLCKMINMVYNKEEGTFEAEEQDGSKFICGYHILHKVLALPEHFSPKHLQAIVDGKLKEGKVLVECEMMCPNKDGGCEEFNKTGKECTHLVPWIKLNSSNHITLHKIEEKMVQVALVKQYIHERMKGITNDLDFNLGAKAAYESILKWFEENVK